MFAAVVGADATPIRPDVKKLLAQPQESAASTDYVPARAGWDGPETPKLQFTDNATLDILSPAATARHARKSLLMAAIPDLRALAAVLLAILLLRRMYKVRRRKTAVLDLAASGSVCKDTALVQPPSPTSPGERATERKAA